MKTPTSVLKGKDSVREYLEKVFPEFSEVSLNTIGMGHHSVVIQATLSGVIGFFYLLVLDDEGAIAQIGVHQEVV